MERAAILGLGVVGRTMVALGGDVAVGIDLNRDRIDLCRSTAGSATDDINAVRGCKLVFICVGTPVLPDGRQDGTQVKQVLENLKAVVDADAVVVIRSTITPEFLPKEYPNSVVVNPEFLRSNSAVHDALHPPFIVVGADPEALAAWVFDWYSECGVSTEVSKLVCTPVEAILLKFACNWFHAVKVEFANMVGELAGRLGADGERIMSMFVRDQILNISERYLTPGQPFDGACLPKDLDVGVSTFHDFADVRLLEAVTKANRARAGTDALDE